MVVPDKYHIVLKLKEVETDVKANNPEEAQVEGLRIICGMFTDAIQYGKIDRLIDISKSTKKLAQDQLDNPRSHS